MRTSASILCLILASCGGPRTGPPALDPEVATFSIVAFDPETGDLGVAVQSKVFGVGVIVPYVRADVGAVATQARAEPGYGPDGLGLMDDGMPAPFVVERLTMADAGRARRQVGMVDAKGRAAAFTGKDCHTWAGQVLGEHYCCQGNILAGETVVRAMAAAFEDGKGALAERLVAALRAGQRAGGDRRGRQSAALLVARRFGGYRGANDRYLDIRVDDHPRPIEELARLLVKRRAFLPEPAVPKRMNDLIREPRTGSTARPSARETWLRWLALRRVRDWPAIHALCADGWRLGEDVHAPTKPDLVALEKNERRVDTPQAKASRGVYLGTVFEGVRAKLYFAVRGGKEPVMVLLVKESGGWRIVP